MTPVGSKPGDTPAAGRSCESAARRRRAASARSRPRPRPAGCAGGAASCRSRPSPCVFLPPAFSDELRSTRAARSAGARPNSRPVRIDTANVKARTRAVERDRVEPRNVAGIDRRARPAARSRATSRPAAPPSSPSRRLSVSSCRTSRCQLAPSAVRTAISFCRPSRASAAGWRRWRTRSAGRASPSPARRAPRSRTLPTTDSTSGTTSIVKVRSRLSFSRIRAAMAATSALRLRHRHARLQTRHDVEVLVAPALDRVGAERQRQKQSICRMLATVGMISSFSRKSARARRRPRTGSSHRRFRKPFNVIGLPTMAGSALNARFQNALLRTTTGGLPGVSSSGRSSRP